MRSRKDPLHCRDMAVVIVPIAQAEVHVQGEVTGTKLPQFSDAILLHPLLLENR